MNPDTTNIIFEQAVEFVNYTSKHIFLSGKAGTGKTTFLKFIKENNYKQLAVLAPTGVAAINAGGVTIHSFFQLPFGLFMPGDQDIPAAGFSNSKITLLKNLRLNHAKCELLKQLDLLIIDEISMVRADLLDCIDVVLRHYRNQQDKPFGGVQMLYIGDLFQLPPIIKNSDWDLLKQYYESPFFFSALALRSYPPLYIELKKIYRQKDALFIDLLNNVRNNICTYADISLLNKHYNPSFSPGKQHYITLTTHNAKADNINNQELEKLTEKEFSYDAAITGEFSEKSYPADNILNLKIGSQIMLIKNDTGERRRYFNGKLGVIEKLEHDKIFIRFADDEILELERETWRNIKYNYNHAKENIEEEEIGTFKQFPVRLAWAITIHKSQGLTFDKAIIDAGESFTPGQVYVALSRLTSLNGLILLSRILPQAISTDRRVLKYARENNLNQNIQQILAAEQKIFSLNLLDRCFSWKEQKDFAEKHGENYPDREASSIIIKIINDQFEIAERFRTQLDILFQRDNYSKIEERTKSAANYFFKEIDEKLIFYLRSYMLKLKQKKIGKKYLADLASLVSFVERKKLHLQEAVSFSEGLALKKDIKELLSEIRKQRQDSQNNLTDTTKVEKRKPETRLTEEISLQMFNAGKSIEEIAKKRKMAIATVELHLVNFVTQNKLSVFELIDSTKLEAILKILDRHNCEFPAEIRQQLGNRYSYGEIRAAIGYWKGQQVTER